MSKIMSSNIPNCGQITTIADDNEVYVLSHAHGFPVHDKDFVMPTLTIAINREGKAHLLYDNYEVQFNRNEVSVVLPDHTLRTIEVSDDYDVTLIFISPSFFDEMHYRSLTNDYMKYHGKPSCQLTEEQTQNLLQIADVIETLTREKLSHKHDTLNYIINVFFELLNNYRSGQEDVAFRVDRKTELFNRFCDLLAKHYTQSREVVFYAEKLCLTPKYFSKIIHDVTQQSAGSWITKHVITMSKQLLSTRPDLNIQNISYMLGFADQAAFSRYFRRATGLSPKEYRENCNTHKETEEQA